MAELKADRGAEDLPLESESYMVILLRLCWFVLPVEFVVAYITGLMKSGYLQFPVVPSLVYITLTKLGVICLIAYAFSVIDEKLLHIGWKPQSRKSVASSWPLRRWLTIALVLWFLTYLIKMISMIAAMLGYEAQPVETSTPCLYDVITYALCTHGPESIGDFMQENYTSPWLFFAASVAQTLVAGLVLLKIKRYFGSQNTESVEGRISIKLLSLGITLAIVHTVVAIWAFDVIVFIDPT